MSKPDKQKPAPVASDPAGARAWNEEADIGSGEKSPGQIETEEHIRQIPPLPPEDGKPAGKPH